MNKIKTVFIAAAAFMFFACESITDMFSSTSDFSIVPIKGSNGEYQYIDLNQKGKIAINPQFSEAHIFRNGLALVKTSGEKGKWGYIDKDGEVVINWQFDYIINSHLGFNNVDFFFEEVAVVALVKEMFLKYGTINKKGETVINPQFDAPFSFYGNKLAPVQMGNKFAYIDRQGQIVINPQFDAALPFLGDYALVMSGGKIGYIDKKGDFIVPPLYEVNTDDIVESVMYIAGIAVEYGNAITQSQAGSITWNYVGISPWQARMKIQDDIDRSYGQLKSYLWERLNALLEYNKQFKHYEKLDEKKEAYRKTLAGTMTDFRDGKIYKTVKMPDGKIWFAENLNYNANGSKCYGNKEENCRQYRLLYDWETAMNACPDGWHLPSIAEWNTLIDTDVGTLERKLNMIQTTVVW